MKQLATGSDDNTVMVWNFKAQVSVTATTQPHAGVSIRGDKEH
jgi:WD40 repeat protein